MRGPVLVVTSEDYTPFRLPIYLCNIHFFSYIYLITFLGRGACYGVYVIHESLQMTKECRKIEWKEENRVNTLLHFLNSVFCTLL